MKDIIRTMISSLTAVKGQLTLNLDKKSMIESKTDKEQNNHLEIRNREIKIIIGPLENDSFKLHFATTFVEKIESEIKFEDQNEIELYLEWSDRYFKILRNKVVLVENNNLPIKSPGGSIQIDIKPMLNEKNDYQYILDIGEKEKIDNERISLFIDKQFNLILRIIDNKGSEFFVTQTKSDFWMPDVMFRVICSWNQKSIKIRTYKAPDYENYKEEINSNLNDLDLFYMPINPPMILGTDLTQKYFCKMMVAEIKLFDIPTI